MGFAHFTLRNLGAQWAKGLRREGGSKSPALQAMPPQWQRDLAGAQANPTLPTLPSWGAAVLRPYWDAWLGLAWEV